MSAPTRPILRWHGGKWRLAPWIISHFPPHRVYVEPFGGAASILLNKERSYAEVYNDLDGELVTLFRVLRDPEASARLISLLRLTPFAKDELDASYIASPDPVECARRLVVRSFMGFSGSGALGLSTGFRSNSHRSFTTPAHDWMRYPDCLRDAIERLAGVTIENAPAVGVLKRHDRPDTLHYVDPPYLPETRTKKKSQWIKHKYRHEMSRTDHAALLRQVKRLKGMVVLSGYPSPLYDKDLRAWTRIERDAYADGSRPRVEVLWINPAAIAAMPRPTQHAFDYAAAAQ